MNCSSGRAGALQHPLPALFRQATRPRHGRNNVHLSQLIEGLRTSELRRQVSRIDRDGPVSFSKMLPAAMAKAVAGVVQASGMSPAGKIGAKAGGNLQHSFLHIPVH